MLKTKDYRRKEVKMGDCTLPLSYNSKIEDRLCRLNYASWCPTCDKDSPRRRTRSETNEPCRRKQKEMKTFTPKKYNRNTEYENMDLEYDTCAVRSECCRIRNNLCELPTTYITNNCQVTNNSQKLSEWTVECLERAQKPVENAIRVVEIPPQMADKTNLKQNPDLVKSLSSKLENYKSHYNVVPKQSALLDTRVSPPRNGYSVSTRSVEFPRMCDKTPSPPKLSVPRNGTTKLSLPKTNGFTPKNTTQLPSIEYCSFYGPYESDERISKSCPSPSSNFNNHKPSQIVEIKMQEDYKNGICYDTGTYFDRQYNSTNLRERYRQEIETLRNRLKEMRNRTHAARKSPAKQINDSNSEIVVVPIVENEVPNTTPIVEICEKKDEETVAEKNEEELELSAKKLLTKSKSLVSVKTGKRSTEISPLSSRRDLKVGVKLTIRNKSKLSAVKMRKLRSKIPSSVSCTDSSDSTESECSDSEKSEKDDGAVEVESEESAVPVKESKEKAVSSKSSLTSCLGSGDSKLPAPSWPIRESMFPHIPPYLSFNTHDAEVPYVLPNYARRYFKWKLSTITPIIVRKTLTNTGFRLVRKSNEWLGTWGKHMKSPMFKTMKDSQKLNHFPGTFQIGRKDRLWRNLQRLMHKYGQKEFGFIPYTYILPQELKFLKQNWEHKNGAGDEKWIIKPPASARGIGIKVINKWSQLPKKIALVVQQYISRPYLINGSKFDLRLYVLVTSFNPLRIYLWPDGLARFASAKYSEDSKSLKDRYMHLTNYSINKMSSQYTANEDANSCQGHKWTLSKLWEYMEGQGVDTKELWKNLQDLVIKTMISGEPSITPLCRDNMNTRYNCYELFGIDVLLDYRLKPWLLEVNISPSLHSASPLDCHVKGPLVKNLFDLAQFHIPSRIGRSSDTPPTYDPKLYTSLLTKKEREKHAYFEQLDCREEYLDEILTNLTGDDVRHLTQAEDEFVAMGQFDRIFPTENTHRYLHFMESRYYNRLFDAWEKKYSNNRIAGIARLQKLCGQKIHLKVAQPSSVNKSLLSMNLGELNLDSLKDGVLPQTQSMQISQQHTNLVEGTILKQTQTVPNINNKLHNTNNGCI